MRKLQSIKFRIISTDRLFASIESGYWLLVRDTTTVRRLEKERKGIPSKLFDTKDRDEFSASFQFKKNIYLRYVTCKNFAVLSITRLLHGKTMDDGRYFKVLIIWLRMESCQRFSTVSCSQTKIEWFEVIDPVGVKIFLGIVLEVPKPVANIENRYECTGKRRKCKIHEDNCWSKSEKDNTPIYKERCQSYGESLCRANSMRICNSYLQLRSSLI